MRLFIVTYLVPRYLLITYTYSRSPLIGGMEETSIFRDRGGNGK